MRFDELRERLGVNRGKMLALIRAGLPYSQTNGHRVYDPAAVDAWLVAHGLAVYEGPDAPGGDQDVENTPDAPGGHAIARTYDELAQALGMPGKNASRRLATWSRRGMPGRVATAGKRDGWFDVDEVRAWIAQNTPSNALGLSGDPELDRRRLSLERLNLQLSEQNLGRELGRLADVDEVATFHRDVVENARAVFEPLSDQIVGVATIPGECAVACFWEGAATGVKRTG